MESIEISNNRLVPCIKTHESDQSISVSQCPKKNVDLTTVDAIEEIDNSCDCEVDNACQCCESEESENGCTTSEKISDCRIFDGVEDTSKNYDCDIEKDCSGCKSKYSHEISQKDSSTSEKIVKCSILDANEQFENSYDCNIDNNCPGRETKNSHEFSQNDSSKSEILVNCTIFSADEDIGNNDDCKDCEGCKIKNSLEDLRGSEKIVDCKDCPGCKIENSLGDHENDRPNSENIGSCDVIDGDEEIGENYDCFINKDCPGCETNNLQDLQNNWPISEKMSAKGGLKCVKKMMQEWNNYRAMQGWKFYAEFLGMESDGASDFYNYHVRWSFPTSAYPEPQVTVSVFFTVKAPRKKHRKCPVDVTYVFEGNQFPHHLKMPFRPKWIYDVLDIKTMMFKSFKF